MANSKAEARAEAKVEALIFDFDGLILDTETIDFTVLSEQYGAHGAQLTVESWMRGLGTHGVDPYAELEQFLDRPVDRRALLDARMRRYRELCDACELLPGVAELLADARARAMPVAVASSSDRAWVEGWLARHTILPLFDCVRTRDDVAQVKPAPDLFLSAAQCLGVAPQHCVVLEDSINGMLAAAAAGMRCVAVPIALLGTAALPPVTLRLGSLADLPLDRLIAELEALPPPVAQGAP